MIAKPSNLVTLEKIAILSYAFKVSIKCGLKVNFKPHLIRGLKIRDWPKKA